MPKKKVDALIAAGLKNTIHNNVFRRCLHMSNRRGLTKPCFSPVEMLGVGRKPLSNLIFAIFLSVPGCRF